jgi:hypothetical protein
MKRTFRKLMKLVFKNWYGIATARGLLFATVVTMLILNMSQTVLTATLGNNAWVVSVLLFLVAYLPLTNAAYVIDAKHGDCKDE